MAATNTGVCAAFHVEMAADHTVLFNASADVTPHIGKSPVETE
jgi:hypothetical protein